MIEFKMKYFRITIEIYLAKSIKLEMPTSVDTIDVYIYCLIVIK